MSQSENEEPFPKKLRLSTVNDFKRQGSPEPETTVEGIKRLRVTDDEKETPMEQDGDGKDKHLAAQRRNYFLTVCESISYGHFSDHKRRFLLVYPPACSLEECEHKSKKEGCLEIPSYAKETFRIDYKSQMWTEALHVCEMAIGPDSYIPAQVMLDIIEIMLNVHPDEYAGYSVQFILDQCLQTLALMFRTHPPCSPVIRKCYKQLLTTPLTVKPETLSDRKEYECEKGIVKYVLNRLESELKPEAKNGPLVNKSDYVTEEMKQSIKGLHWQKDRLEIFETLKRTERMKRLMAVLRAIVMLLTSDLSIWLSRHIHNQGTHIMRSHRPLLSIILWSDKILYTGAVNNNCRQIISLFVDFVHLGLPESDIQIMTQMLNAIIQTFYMCENNSDGDYPHTGKYCSKFADEVFAKIKDLPPKSKINVIQRIHPTFMRHSVVLLCVKAVLQRNGEDIIAILMDFLKNKSWQNYQSSGTISSSAVQLSKKLLRIYNGFSKNLIALDTGAPGCQCAELFPKRQGNREIYKFNREEIVELLLVGLDAYLDSYSMEKIQKCLAHPDMTLDENCRNSSYSLSEGFYKRYRTICKDISELKNVLKGLRGECVMELFKGYQCLSLLGL